MKKIILIALLFSTALPAFALVPANQGPRTDYTVSPIGTPTRTQFCNLNPWSDSCKPLDLSPEAVSAPVPEALPVMEDAVKLINELRIQILKLQIRILQLQIRRILGN